MSVDSSMLECITVAVTIEDVLLCTPSSVDSADPKVGVKLSMALVGTTVESAMVPVPDDSNDVDVACRVTSGDSSYKLDVESANVVCNSGMTISDVPPLCGVLASWKLILVEPSLMVGRAYTTFAEIKEKRIMCTRYVCKLLKCTSAIVLQKALSIPHGDHYIVLVTHNNSTEVKKTEFVSVVGCLARG